MRDYYFREGELIAKEMMDQLCLDLAAQKLVTRICGSICRLCLHPENTRDSWRRKPVNAYRCFVCAYTLCNHSLQKSG